MTPIVQRVLDGARLDAAEAEDLLATLADEALSPAVAGAVLAVLRARGETAEEVRGFATAMRRLARRPDLPGGPPALDIVGTGGDGSSSLNLSTGAALLAAAAGAPVVKHGNRAVSGRCGSADVLEALGLALPLDERAAGRCLAAVGFTFLFAPYYHPAAAVLARVRKALGVRTVFNLLGPLTNPAAPPFSVIGACSESAAALLAEALAGLPIERAFVVSGEGSWDEPTPAGPFLLLEVRPGSVAKTRRDPSEAGYPRCGLDTLRGGDAAHNAGRLRDAFAGERGPHRDALVLGAALGLEVSGRAGTPAEGRAAAEAAIDSGAAARLLERLAGFGAGRDGASGGADAGADADPAGAAGAARGAPRGTPP